MLSGWQSVCICCQRAPIRFCICSQVLPSTVSSCLRSGSLWVNAATDAAEVTRASLAMLVVKVRVYPSGQKLQGACLHSTAGEAKRASASLVIPHEVLTTFMEIFFVPAATQAWIWRKEQAQSTPRKKSQASFN